MGIMHGPFAQVSSPGNLMHFHRIERMTNHFDEATLNWGRGWMRTPDLDRLTGNYRGSDRPRSTPIRASSEDLRNSCVGKTTIEKKMLLDMAKKAEQEEMRQSLIREKRLKTTTYCDRNRFRCIGSPLQTTGDRDMLRTRTRTTARLGEEEQRRLATPVCETYHWKEQSIRANTILKRHSHEKPARVYGMRRSWDGKRAASAPPGRVDVVGFGSATKVIMTNDEPVELDKTLLTETQDALEFSPMDPEIVKERRRPISAYSQLPFRNQMIMVPRTANQPLERRVFMGAHKGHLFDPEASLRLFSPGSGTRGLMQEKGHQRSHSSLA